MLSERVNDDTPSSDGPAPPARWRAICGVAVAALVAAFVVSVVRSTPPASVPVGASGPMPGMTMNTDRLQFTMHDIRNRPVRIPDARPGVLIFAEARRCNACVTAVRAADEAVRDTRTQLIVVMLDSNTSRADITTFAHAAGPGRARYVIDDRNSRIAAMFDAPTLGGAVVYDARGQVVAHPEPRTRQIAAALRRSAR